MQHNESPSFVHGIRGVLDAFADVPIVALGDSPGLQEEVDFITTLLHHPEFPKTVNDIVVSFGNALYQPIVDRFLNGEIVADIDLRPIWRDIFLSIGFAFQAPIYEQFFRTIRAINRSLPYEQRIKVILGDPALDWQRVHSREDILQVVQQQEEFFADLVKRTVFINERKALLLATSSQLVRMSEATWLSSERNITQLIEQEQPHSTFVIIPHCGFPAQNELIEASLISLPIPSLITLAESALGKIEAHRYFDEEAMKFHNQQGNIVEQVVLQDLADAYLYLGPRNSLTMSYPNPAIYRGDKLYLDEIDRRRKIWGMAPYPRRTLYAEPKPDYQKYGC